MSNLEAFALAFIATGIALTYAVIRGGAEPVPPASPDEGMENEEPPSEGWAAR